MFKRLFSKNIRKNKETNGVIAKAIEDGKPVIYAITHTNLTEMNKREYPQLLIISWEYDGSVNNGMPSKDINKKMIALEDAIQYLESKGLCIHAVHRTGNGLKEFIYYYNDEELLMREFNNVLAPHERYPIDIKFYQDPEWQEMHRHIDMLKK